MRHFRVFFLVLLLALTLTACGGGANRWEGSYSGDALESSQITTYNADGSQASVFTGSQTRAVTVTLTPQEDGSLLVAFDDCALPFTPPQNESTEVAGSPTCVISINGYQGEMTFSGQGYFDRDGVLRLSLIGAAAEPDAAGSYSFMFTSKEE